MGIRSLLRKVFGRDRVEYGEPSAATSVPDRGERTTPAQEPVENTSSSTSSSAAAAGAGTASVPAQADKKASAKKSGTSGSGIASDLVAEAFDRPKPESAEQKLPTQASSSGHPVAALNKEVTANAAAADPVVPEAVTPEAVTAKSVAPEAEPVTAEAQLVTTETEPIAEPATAEAQPVAVDAEPIAEPAAAVPATGAEAKSMARSAAEPLAAEAKAPEAKSMTGSAAEPLAAEAKAPEAKSMTGSAAEPLAAEAKAPEAKSAATEPTAAEANAPESRESVAATDGTRASRARCRGEARGGQAQGHRQAADSRFEGEARLRGGLHGAPGQAHSGRARHARRSGRGPVRQGGGPVRQGGRGRDHSRTGGGFGRPQDPGTAAARAVSGRRRRTGESGARRGPGRRLPGTRPVRFHAAVLQGRQRSGTRRADPRPRRTPRRAGHRTGRLLLDGHRRHGRADPRLDEARSTSCTPVSGGWAVRATTAPSRRSSHCTRSPATQRARHWCLPDGRRAGRQDGRQAGAHQGGGQATFLAVRRVRRARRQGLRLPAEARPANAVLLPRGPHPARTRRRRGLRELLAAFPTWLAARTS